METQQLLQLNTSKSCLILCTYFCLWIIYFVYRFPEFHVNHPSLSFYFCVDNERRIGWLFQPKTSVILTLFSMTFCDSSCCCFLYTCQIVMLIHWLCLKLIPHLPLTWSLKETSLIPDLWRFIGCLLSASWSYWWYSPWCIIISSSVCCSFHYWLMSCPHFSGRLNIKTGVSFFCWTSFLNHEFL